MSSTFFSRALAALCVGVGAAASAQTLDSAPTLPATPAPSAAPLAPLALPPATAVAMPTPPAAPETAPPVVIIPVPPLPPLPPALEKSLAAFAADTPAPSSSPSARLQPDDLWQRVRRGFTMGDLNTPFTQTHEQWYASRPDYIQRFVDRGSRYLYHIVEEVERRNMPTEIVLLPIIESAFNPQSLSSAKAVGMWQFMPATGKRFGLTQDASADNRRDVLLSTNAALDYLQKLHDMFNSWELALAAYNCGEGCIARAIATNTRKGLPTDLMSLPIPNETRNYVPKLLAVKNIVLSPGAFGIDLTSVENRPYFAKVTAPAKIDVKLAARLAEMEPEEFAALNPAFKRPVAASGTGFFLVPTDKGSIFEENLRLYRSLNGPMVSWQTVSAKRGESVDAVARRHGMTASYLRATNGSLPERKGKFTQPVNFMAPHAGQAHAINAAFDKKVALRNAGGLPVSEGLMRAGAAPTPITPPRITPPREAVIHSELSYAPTDRDIVLDGKLIRAGGAATSAAPAITAEPITDDVNYVVESGDTLYGIARKFSISLDSLLQLNQLSTKSRLVPGKKLRISA